MENSLLLVELKKINEKLSNIEKHLGLIEIETEKNAEVASLFNKYIPTINKVENAINLLVNPRNWKFLSFGIVNLIE